MVRYQSFDVAIRWACVVLLTQPIGVRRAVEELHPRNSEVELVCEISLSVWISLEPSIKDTCMSVMVKMLQHDIGWIMVDELGCYARQGRQ
jgi:hypothetical protein